MTDAASRRARGRHRRPGDRIYRSSFFLLVSTVVTAGLSFVFWVVVARFYTPSQVGLATSLISATSLLATFSLLGLNNTLIRFPAEREARNAQISQAMVLVTVVGFVAGGIYLAGLPLYGAKLGFVRDNWMSAVAFAGFCGCAATSMLVKSVFNAARIPEYNVLIDGLTQGASKVAVPAVLTGLGVFGIVASAGVGYVVTVVVAVVVLWRRLGFRVDLRTRGTRLREKFRFSVASHVSNLINLAPVLAIPLIVLHHLGAAATGYYFVAFQIAAMLNAVSTAVGEAVFAEVSHEESRFRELMLRSARIIAAVQVPAAAVVVAGGGLLLRMFGGGYAENARPLLTVLALAALPVALNTWACFALKLAQRMRHLIAANTIMACLSIGLSSAFADRGLVWIGYAWATGNAVAGVFATVSLVRRPRTTSSPATAATATPAPEPRPEPALVAPWPPGPVEAYPAAHGAWYPAGQEAPYAVGPGDPYGVGLEYPYAAAADAYEEDPYASYADPYQADPYRAGPADTYAAPYAAAPAFPSHTSHTHRPSSERSAP
ncbi:lipopolysaccharide biosynthesis protein [Streptomyces fulvoviolaceus]|uniref:lipopolysaccharide biosynthesis protein n=1 Tax=Streptomyces fulvoviolaceus TaxID=285535 RepID=UPI0004C4AE66|nr:lipopolysaccharide biosynthesis protein [Streptomyces fulvoviolaceus]MCT9082296.1 lipopolysaccharide biosynthesis protein [Streptomyces fulvoviolaceus]